MAGTKANKTSFKKGNKGKQKGTTHKTTRIKKAVGLDNWDNLQSFLLNEGTTKFIEELSKLKGVSYTIAYLQSLEYFKPKRSRVDEDGNSENVKLIHVITPE